MEQKQTLIESIKDKLFGIPAVAEPENVNRSFAPPEDLEGTTVIEGTGFFGTYIESGISAKNENDLIIRYRDISTYPDTDSAIEDIVTEAISVTGHEQSVTIDLDKLDFPPNIKLMIRQEFKNVLQLLDFKNRSHDVFRRWYIDGRIYYHKIIDPKQPQAGIIELRYVNPLAIKKVREAIKKKDEKTKKDIIVGYNEYYLYTDSPDLNKNQTTAPRTVSGATQAFKIAPEAIIYCNSGLVDANTNDVLSFLHKAIKPVNQLRMMEDAAVIYRLARAPERRIFYVDVGNLPKNKAEQYMADIMAKYKNRVSYNASTGEVRDDKKYLSMLEDFWMPRREGSTGTEIKTLQGASNISDIQDISYFKENVYRSLNVPLSRMQQGSGFNFGRQAEISRDELKFTKFVQRLRNKFTEIFMDALRTQLQLKNIMSIEEFDYIKDDIEFKFSVDTQYEENKKLDALMGKMEILQQIAPFVGVYFSKRYVMQNVMMMDEDQIEEMEIEMASEMEAAGVPSNDDTLYNRPPEEEPAKPAAKDKKK